MITPGCSFKVRIISIISYFMLLVGLELFGVLTLEVKNAEIRQSIIYFIIIFIYALYWPLFMVMGKRVNKFREWVMGFPIVGTGIAIHGFSILMTVIGHFNGEVYMAFLYASIILGVVVDLISFVWIYYMFMDNQNGAVQH
jgi:hypothetical protein